MLGLLLPPAKAGHCKTVGWGVWRRVSRFHQGYIKGMGKGMTKCVPYSCTLELLGVNRRPFGNRNDRKKAHAKPIEEFHFNCVAGKAQRISNFRENRISPCIGICIRPSRASVPARRCGNCRRFASRMFLYISPSVSWRNRAGLCESEAE